MQQLHSQQGLLRLVCCQLHEKYFKLEIGRFWGFNHDCQRCTYVPLVSTAKIQIVSSHHDNDGVNLPALSDQMHKTVGWVLIARFNDCVLGQVRLNCESINNYESRPLYCIIVYVHIHFTFMSLLIANIGKTCN